MDENLIIAIFILVITTLFIIFNRYFNLKKQKEGKRKVPDNKVMKPIGLIFLGIGVGMIAFLNPIGALFLIVGIGYLIIGISRKQEKQRSSLCFE